MKMPNNNDEVRYCPILSSYPDNPVPCQRELCQWWCKKRHHCNICIIGRRMPLWCDEGQSEG